MQDAAALSPLSLAVPGLGWRRAPAPEPRAPLPHAERVSVGEQGRGAGREPGEAAVADVRWYRAALSGRVRAGAAARMDPDGLVRTPASRQLASGPSRPVHAGVQAYQRALELGAG